MRVHVHTQDSEVVQKIAGFNKMAMVIRCCRAQSKKRADQQLVYGSFYVPFSPFSHACSLQSTLTPPFFFACVLPYKQPSSNYFFIIGPKFATSMSIFRISDTYLGHLSIARYY